MSKKKHMKHCCIIGLGLLGGSLAIDLRRHYPGLRVTGIARRKVVRTQAAQLVEQGVQVFSSLSADLAAAAEADLIVLCTPIQTIIEHLAQLSTLVAPGTIITDVGSTKRAIMNAASTALPTGIHFIGGHPMAGSDRSGISHARAGLYTGATWALCIPDGESEAGAMLMEIITSIGARPLMINAVIHDSLVGLTSHLPHIVAGALVNQVLGSSHGDAVLPFLAGGFRDTTRIAASNPAMWRDIMLTNRDNILSALDMLLDELQVWRAAVHAGDEPYLEALLTTAQQRREDLNGK